MCLCSFFVSISLFAQDIIVTKDAKKIEAKILEVSKNEIKYKEFNYLDGPTFVLGVEDINTIIYANGKVELYSNNDNNNQFAEKAEPEPTAQEESDQTVIVDFEIEGTSNPYMWNFINQSSGATDFRWDFGNDLFSFGKNATCVYEMPGTYTVTLTALVGDQKFVQQKTLAIGGRTQQAQPVSESTQQQLEESGGKLVQSIQKLIEVENSYALDVKNTTKYPYRINLDGHILGVVNPYKIQRFIVSVETYGRMQAVQTSGYTFSPTIKEYRVPRQQKKSAYTVVIK